MSLTTGIQVPIGIQTINPLPTDSWAGPYASVAEANTSVPVGVRFIGKTVIIIISSVPYDYWWSGSTADSSLVLKSLGGGSPSVAWGTITGTLSSQTDLQTALATKFNSPSGSSSQYIKGDGTLGNFSAISPSWGSIIGTLSAQSDLQAALNLKFNIPPGTTSQYIRGDGSLATLPTATAPAWGSITGAITSQTDLVSALNGKYNSPLGSTSQYVRGDGSLASFPAGITPTWGAITGTLSSQSDLQTVLNGKFNIPTGTNTQYIRGDGSLATFGTTTWGTITGTLSTQADLQTKFNTFVDLTNNQSIGGYKIFTSSLTFPENFTLSGPYGNTFFSNLGISQSFLFPDAGGIFATREWSNANKFNIPTGTTSQYIRGDGSLATYTGGGGGSSVWGGITGTLSSQTDLQSALNLKYNTPVGTTSQYVRGDGSLATYGIGTIGYQIVSANYTTISTDQYLECSGTITITLLSTGISVGKSYEVINTGTGTITILGSGGVLINGLSNKILNIQNQTAKAVWNGTSFKLYY